MTRSSVRSSVRHVVAAALGLALVLTGAACSNDSSATPAASGQKDGSLVGTAFQPPRPRPSFTLTDTLGKSFDFKARTAGQPTLLFFGFTHCPDICPTTMSDLASVLRDVPADLAQQTRVVFVTTDPKRDKPAVIGRWLSYFDGGLPAPFIGLTGTVSEVETVQRLVGVPVAEDDGQTHSTQILLYGADDVARVFYLAGSKPADISHDLPLVATKGQ